MSVNAPEAPAAFKPKTFYCVWPDHKMYVGQPTFSMTADGERGHYSRDQRVVFENQRYTATDPVIAKHLEAECRRQPQVFSERWIPNPKLSGKDQAAKQSDHPSPAIHRGAKPPEVR